MLTKAISLQRAQIKATGSGDAMQFEGYASVFGGVDSYGDTIAPGAYADTLADGHQIPMLFSHRHDQPIGKFLELAEDEVGLWVKGELTRGVRLAEETHLLMKHEAVTGMSIGYRVRGSEDLDDGLRKLTKIDLQEISVVSLPADDAARIQSVKMAGKDAMDALELVSTIKGAEQFLRDSGAFSRKVATKFVATVLRLADQSDSDVELAQAIGSLTDRVKARVNTI